MGAGRAGSVGGIYPRPLATSAEAGVPHNSVSRHSLLVVSRLFRAFMDR